MTKFGKGLFLFIFVSVLTVVIVVLLWRPYAPMRAEELVGNYTFDCDIVDGQLTLRPNREFFQTMYIKSTGQRLTADGTWNYRTKVIGGITLGEISFDGMVVVLAWPGELRTDLKSLRPGGVVDIVWDWDGQIVIGEEAEGWPVWRRHGDRGGVTNR